MKTITKEELINFIFDFETISENKMKRAMRKNKQYLIKIAHYYEKDDQNKNFYRALILN